LWLREYTHAAQKFPNESLLLIGLPSISLPILSEQYMHTAQKFPNESLIGFAEVSRRSLKGLNQSKDLFRNFCVMSVYSQKSTTDSKGVPRIVQNGFHPWDGLAIRGNNSSVAAKGVPRMLQNGFHSWDGLAIRGNNSSVAAKGVPRIVQNGFHPWDGLAIRVNNSSVTAKGCVGE
jgi:hypothetical protein